MTKPRKVVHLIPTQFAKLCEVQIILSENFAILILLYTAAVTARGILFGLGFLLITRSSAQPAILGNIC
jgi:hypothetical protein